MSRLRAVILACAALGCDVAVPTSAPEDPEALVGATLPDFPIGDDLRLLADDGPAAPPEAYAGAEPYVFYIAYSDGTKPAVVGMDPCPGTFPKFTSTFGEDYKRQIQN